MSLDEKTDKLIQAYITNPDLQAAHQYTIDHTPEGILPDDFKTAIQKASNQANQGRYFIMSITVSYNTDASYDLFYHDGKTVTEIATSAGEGNHIVDDEIEKREIKELFTCNPCKLGLENHQLNDKEPDGDFSYFYDNYTQDYFNLGHKRIPITQLEFEK